MDEMKPKSGYVFSVYNLHTKKRQDLFVQKQVLDMLKGVNEDDYHGGIGLLIDDLMDKTNEVEENPELLKEE